MIHFQKTLAIKSDYAEAENNLGNVFFGKGQMDDAVAHYQKALEIQPDYASAHNNLGNVFLRRGELNQINCALSESYRDQTRFGRSA